mmetsp:Transcript_17623/g.40790  ORF Transcript_17623/g.40790 Transcript_17623/m.40790 type:complete len:295 (-) Transcript_17623:151-1035(-)
MGLTASKAPRGGGQDQTVEAEQEEPQLPAVQLTVETLSGKSADIQISPSETVHTLKECIATALGLPAQQLKVVLGATDLGLGRLVEYGIEKDCSVTAIVLPTLPDFARVLGMDIEHMSVLRSYCEQHKYPGLQSNEWLTSDDAHWQHFGLMHERHQEEEKALASWSARLQIEKIEKSGVQKTALHAFPGEKIQVQMTGRVWNRTGDSCVHQLLILLDGEIQCELYNGVPSRGRNVKKSFNMLAPKEKGVYMFWRDTQLQYTMQDARRSTMHRVSECILPDQYFDGRFIGWLIVE